MATDKVSVEQRDRVTIRFAGDSGDGIQLTGSQFTHTSAIAGNDLATFPDFPAEIRAPAGTLAGVSGFQIHFASSSVFTHGDTPDVLVAMNPAALKANLSDLKRGGVLIVNTHPFNAKNLERAGFDGNPLEGDELSAYKVYPIDITTMTLNAIADVGLNQRSATRSKNFFALGLIYWLFNRDMVHTERWIEEKFQRPTLRSPRLIARPSKRVTSSERPRGYLPIAMSSKRQRFPLVATVISPVMKP